MTGTVSSDRVTVLFKRKDESGRT